MKYRLMFKTNDVLDQLDMQDEEQKQLAKEFAEKFVTYGEYITIEFDTETQTAKAICQ